MDLDAVGGHGTQVARRPELSVALALGAGPGAVDAQDVLVWVDDHVAAGSVDD